MIKTVERFDCLVLGAGIAGITAARKMVAAGFSVCLLDKSRGLGGRFATRRIEGQSFDHGAQFFTARGKVFSAEVQNWVEAGIARPWFGKPGHERFWGVGGMNRLAKELSVGLDVRRDQKVEWVGFSDGVWSVRSNQGALEGYRLLLTNPAPQAVDLLVTSEVDCCAEFLDTLNVIEYEKCISLMLLLGSELGLSESGIIQSEEAEPIATITETSVKGITDLPGIVIQSGPEFAEENFGASPDTVFKRLTDALPISGNLDVEGMSVQKWRFAKRKDHALECFFNEDESNFIWHSGDGYNAPRIEGAFLSGERVAESIISSLSVNCIPTTQEPGKR